MYVKKVGGSVSLGSGDGITFAYALCTTDYNHYFRGDTGSTNIDVYTASDAALVETELIFMLQCWRKGTVFNNFKFQIEVVEGTTAPTTYTPYNRQTNTLTLPETVYGGEVDAVTGECQREWQTLTINDGSKISMVTSQPYFYTTLNALGGFPNPAPNTASNRMYSNLKYSVNITNSPDNNTIALYETGIIRIYVPGIATRDDAAAWVEAHPIQIAYRMATPIPFTATGAQPIPALAGANTILTDADSATVTGRADPITRITDLEDAVASQT